MTTPRDPTGLLVRAILADVAGDLTEHLLGSTALRTHMAQLIGEAIEQRVRERISEIRLPDE